MTDRINELIEELNLQPHPEGGFYSEIYRSVDVFGNRNLMTSIYFLLTSNNVSKFHSIKSDELWFFHEGSSLTVHVLDNGKYIEKKLGLLLEKNEKPQLLVEKNLIFGSSVNDEDSYALVSCVVSPGFDFKDFKLYSFNELIENYPDKYDIIKKLT